MGESMAPDGLPQMSAYLARLGRLDVLSKLGG